MFGWNFCLAFPDFICELNDLVGCFSLLKKRSVFVLFFFLCFGYFSITEIFGYCKLYRDYRQPFFNSIFPFSLSFSYCGSLHTDDITFAYDSAVRCASTLTLRHVRTNPHTHRGTQRTGCPCLVGRAALFHAHSVLSVPCALRIHIMSWIK